MDGSERPYHRIHRRWIDDLDRAPAVERYLSARERAAYEQRRDRSRTAWLLGRLAAKQAYAQVLAARGSTVPDLRRIEVSNDERGRPFLRPPADPAQRHPDLNLSIAHSDAAGVAIVVAGRPVGIDIEIVEPRSPRFDQITMTVAERALEPVDGDDRDTWLTRAWVAKEAAAKATGRGLGGRPKDFEIGSVEQQRLRVLDRWVVTEIVTHGDDRYVVGWTEG